jgi:DNA adenine methylase
MQTKPIIPWMGGKRRLAKHIIPKFPEHSCYVEPFAGGGALFFMRPSPAKVELLNDINQDLVNLYRCVQHHLEEFVRQFKWSLISRQMFTWLKSSRPETLTDIQRAARFYYIQKMAFGGKSVGPTFSMATTSAPKLNLLRVEEDLSAAHIRLSRAYIEHLLWAECIKRYDRPHSLFYCDPPYWQVTGYGTAFPWHEYEAMAKVMDSIKGKMIISINDHEDIRRLFSQFRIEPLDVRYTAGGGGKEAKELLIFNW